MVASSKSGENYDRREKETDTVISNIMAAQAVSDFIRTSLGPRGMDKMIVGKNKDVVVSNDGATILDNLNVLHPVARMLVELSKSQDIEAGDGTTSVVVIAGALLEQSRILVEKGIHPNIISENFQLCAKQIERIIETMATKVSIENDEVLTDVAITALGTKIVSPNAKLLAPIAVKAIKTVLKSSNMKNNVDLNDIKVVTMLGGTIEDSEFIDGLVFPQKASHQAGGPTSIKNAKIAFIQFQLSPPKPDMEFSVSIQKNEEIDRLHAEERRYAARLVQKIAKSGANLLLVQKSIIRDAVSPLALHFLARKGVMVVTDVERDAAPSVAAALGCRPVAAPEDLTPERLGSAASAEERSGPGGAAVFVRGAARGAPCASVLLRGSSRLVLAEAERSLHDALCVVRCLVRAPAVLPGGAAAEMELAVQLRRMANEFSAGSNNGGADAGGGSGGERALCWEAFAAALEAVPFTLAENCGLAPVRVLTELREAHERGERAVGVDVRRGRVADLSSGAGRVLQPALVTLRAVALAAECVQMVLKIDSVLETVKS